MFFLFKLRSDTRWKLLFTKPSGIVRVFDRTGLLAQPGQCETLPLCNLAIMSIECDDVSSCTPTPRSVLNTDGKSGASMAEFLMHLKSILVTFLLKKPCFGELFLLLGCTMKHENTHDPSEFAEVFGPVFF